MGCFGGGGGGPAVPAMTPQELELIQKSGLTLDRFNEMLNAENLDKKDTQSLLRQLSGLYRTEDVAGTPETSTLAFKEPTVAAWKGQLASSGIAGAKDLMVSWENHLKGVGFTDNMVEDLKSELARNPKLNVGAAFDAVVAKARGDLPYAQRLGLTTGQVTPGTGPSTREVVDPDAVAKLRGRLQADIEAGRSLNEQANKWLQDFFNKPKSEYEQLQEEAGVLSARRLVAALKGELPLSAGFEQRKQQDWEALKEAYGRQGIEITGDTPQEGASTSTAGVQALMEFQKRYKYAEDMERRGEIDSGTQQNLQRYGLVADMGNQRFGQVTSLRSQPGQQELGLLTSALGLSSPNPGYLNVAQGFGGLTQPFGNYNAMRYQSNAATWQNRQQGQQGLGMLGGYVLASALTGGTAPWWLGAGKAAKSTGALDLLPLA